MSARHEKWRDNPWTNGEEQSYGVYWQSNYYRDQRRRQTAREESVVELLKEIRDKLPQGSYRFWVTVHV